MDEMPVAPLQCWDIFIDHYDRLRQAGLDLQALNKLVKQYRWDLGIDLPQRLVRDNQTIVITNADQQIIFASGNMQAMSGYTPEEVLGRNPTMFQGVGTDPAVRLEIRTAIALQRPFRAVILNYRKDSSSYHCSIEAYPLHDPERNATHFIAFEQEVRMAG
jgi:PAS domain S-box-containing protein